MSLWQALRIGQHHQPTSHIHISPQPGEGREGQALTCHLFPRHLPHGSTSQGCHVRLGQGEPGSWSPSSLISNRFPPPGSTGIASSPAALQSGNSYCRVAEGSTGTQLEMDGWMDGWMEHISAVGSCCWVMQPIFEPPSLKENCLNTSSAVFP